MSKIFTAVVIALAVLATTLVWTHNPPASKVTIEASLEELNQALNLLEEEANEDSVLMRFIRKYREQSLSSEQLEQSLRKLHGLTIDLIPMIHHGYGITEQNEQKVIAFQKAIAELVRKDYELMWSEDFTGGRLMSKDNAWEEIRTEFQNTTVPLTSYDFSRRSIEEFLEKQLPFSAGHQLVVDPQGVKVRGGDYRPIKNIQQRLLEYAPLYQLGKVPSSLSPAKLPMITRALDKGRDLYLLKQVADHRSKERQVIVFGKAHTDHLSKLMIKYGVKGEVIEFGFE